MKRQIRYGVFETNSSSMHSLVVKKESCYYTEDELRKGIYLTNEGWNIWDTDELHFGRTPFRCLNTFESKVRYAIASLCCYRNDRSEQFVEIENVVKEIIPECVGIELPELWNGTDYVKCYGGVDCDILSLFLEKEKISLREFLTNKKYIVIVDGDEYHIWNSIKDTGLIDVDKIEKEY